MIREDAALAQHETIKSFVAGVFLQLKSLHVISFVLTVHCCRTGTVADSAPIIPVSAVLKYNIDIVCECIANYVPIPVRDFTAVPRLIGMANNYV